MTTATTTFEHNTEADRDFRFFGGDVQGLQGRVERMFALTVEQVELLEAGVAANLAVKLYQAARSLERAQFDAVHTFPLGYVSDKREVPYGV